jgi:hypothetical protein
VALSGTARWAAVPIMPVPCRAVPKRARASAVPGGPSGKLYGGASSNEDAVKTSMPRRSCCGWQCLDIAVVIHHMREDGGRYNRDGLGRWRLDESHTYEDEDSGTGS